ncbi:MAG: hypothetical protein ACI4OM_03190, partial [Evtepia sp.]
IRVPLAAVLIGSPLGLDGMWLAILVSHVAAVLIAFAADRKGDRSREVSCAGNRLGNAREIR